MRFRLILIATILVFLSQNSIAQIIDKKLVQFSGVVVTSDSLHPVPFTNIIIKGTSRGTVSDYFGFFSFVAKKGDTVRFSSIGFKTQDFIIPTDLKESRYSMIQSLITDTLQLREALIYPWPTKEEFKQAFVELDLVDDDLERAKKNLDDKVLADLAEDLEMDGSLNFKVAAQQRSYQLYYAGQLPPNNLLNPIAWSKFIQAWKNGDFKRKDN